VVQISRGYDILKYSQMMLELRGSGRHLIALWGADADRLAFVCALSRDVSALPS